MTALLQESPLPGATRAIVAHPVPPAPVSQTRAVPSIFVSDEEGEQRGSKRGVRGGCSFFHMFFKMYF